MLQYVYKGLKGSDDGDQSQVWNLLTWSRAHWMLRDLWEHPLIKEVPPQQITHNLLQTLKIHFLMSPSSRRQDVQWPGREVREQLCSAWLSPGAFPSCSTHCLPNKDHTIHGTRNTTTFSLPYQASWVELFLACSAGFFGERVVETMNDWEADHTVFNTLKTLVHIVLPQC